MDRVLVIIVTYNAQDWIHQCLNSVDMERYDAFVVDNASTDDTLSILQAEYPKAIVRLMDKNLGLSAATFQACFICSVTSDSSTVSGVSVGAFVEDTAVALAEPSLLE